RCERGARFRLGVCVHGRGKRNQVLEKPRDQQVDKQPTEQRAHCVRRPPGPAPGYHAIRNRDHQQHTHCDHGVVAKCPGMRLPRRLQVHAQPGEFVPGINQQCDQVDRQDLPQGDPPPAVEQEAQPARNRASKGTGGSAGAHGDVHAGACVRYGRLRVAMTPCGTFLARRSCAAPPYKRPSRVRTLASPVPPPELWRKPAPSSLTRSSKRPSTTCTAMHTVPPLGNGARPCLIAFSTSVISINGGSMPATASASASMRQSRRVPMRTAWIRRYASARSSAFATGICCALRFDHDVRRYWSR